VTAPDNASDQAAVRFKRSVAVLVGTVAVVAAVLNFIQAETSRRADNASAAATIDSITASAQLSAGGSRDQFERDAERRVALLTQSAISRATAVAPGSATLSPNALLAEVEAKTAARLAGIRQRMRQLPTSPPGVDRPMLEALAAVDPDHVDSLLNSANTAADDSDLYGGRSSKLSAAIVLLAVAGALLGLAALIGPDRGGRISRNTAVAASIAAIVWALLGFA
jgi:hypothetical protein